MSYTDEPLAFKISLALSAHVIARKFTQHQSNQEKAKQVYFNTLAVYAVNFYLQCLGFETDLEKSDSWNPAMQTLMDIADLEVKRCGKLECRPVLADSEICYFPAEVWSERVGYVAVQISESLTEATLLGFTETAPFTGELPISYLRSLEDLPQHLHQLRQPESAKIPVNLSLWLQNMFEPGWQSIETLSGVEQKKLAFSFRSNSQLNTLSVRRAKLINLGLQLASQAVVLIVIITKEAQQEEVTIRVQVHPEGGDTYLPANIRLVLLLKSGEILDEAESRSLDNFIQLNRFEGVSGECFNIQVASTEASVIESFVI